MVFNGIGVKSCIIIKEVVEVNRMNKVLVRYIEENTMSSSGLNHRNNDIHKIELCGESKGKKTIESNMNIFDDVWM